MDFANIKSITIPEGEVTKIELDGIILWQAVTYKNWVKYSTEADGTTIYNGGLGYKDGYRVRSGGAEAEQAGSSCTGFIPFTKSDQLYVYPQFTNQNTNNAVNFYDSSFACLGQITDSGAAYGICASAVAAFKTTAVNGVSVLDLSVVTVSGVENIAYVRITNNIYNGGIASGSEMIITKNEEIPL